MRYARFLFLSFGNLLAMLCACLLLFSCSPELPKKATSDVATGYEAITANYKELEDSFIAESNKRNNINLLKTYRQIVINFDADNTLATVLNALKRDIERILEGKQIEKVRFQEYRGKMAEAAQQLEVLELIDTPRGKCNTDYSKYYKEFGYKVQKRNFNKKFVAVLQVLNQYYATIALAAEAEDLTRQHAELQILNSKITSMSDSAVSAFPCFTVVSAMLKASLALALQIKSAADISERYDAIEDSLQSIDAEILDDLENYLALSVLYLQAGGAMHKMHGALHLAVVDFNCTNPKNFTKSYAKFSVVEEELYAVRAILNNKILESILQLREIHEKLTKDVADRKNDYSATLQRVVAATTAAKEAHATIKQFLNEEQ